MNKELKHSNNVSKKPINPYYEFKKQIKSKSMINKPQKYIKTKVIEAYLIFENPKKLMHVVMAADSIDTVVLDLQEANPEQKINRESIIKWKFLTVEDCKKLGLLTKGRYLNIPK